MAGVSEPDTPAGGTMAAPPPETRPPKARTRPGTSMLEPSILRRGIGEAFVKLDPRKIAGRTRGRRRRRFRRWIWRRDATRTNWEA